VRYAVCFFKSSGVIMRVHQSCFISVAIFFMLSANSAHAAENAVQAGTVNVIDRHVASDYNGVVAVRAELNAPLLTRATGLAGRDPAIPNNNGSRFMIGSISKWISAVTVLRLVDLGKLDLDTPIARHLPELPSDNGAVTLRQLLSNRSGIPNGVSTALRKDPTIAQLDIGPVAGALRFGAEPLNAAPGEKWEYSYTNWVLVAAVVERANNKPFMDTVRELVLMPAHVHDTDFAASAGEVSDKMAEAYATSGARKVSPAPPMVAASGTLYSTAHDLVALADTVYFSKLLSDRARKELSNIQVATEDYALGGRVRSVNTGKGKRVLAWESGSSGGYKTLLAYDPLDGCAVVLLNNTDMEQSEQAAIAISLFGEM
jgi:D-alanyl-D-alanine carboxypeptidase